jgi:hypothetical protein
MHGSRCLFSGILALAGCPIAITPPSLFTPGAEVPILIPTGALIRRIEVMIQPT